MLLSNYIGFLLNLKDMSVISCNEYIIVLSLPRSFYYTEEINNKIKILKRINLVV